MRELPTTRNTGPPSSASSLQQNSTKQAAVNDPSVTWKCSRPRCSTAETMFTCAREAVAATTGVCPAGVQGGRRGGAPPPPLRHKVDGGTHLRRLSAKRRVDLLSPRRHRRRVLLAGPVGVPLRGQAQPAQHRPHPLRGEPHPEHRGDQVGDEVTGPQVLDEPVVPRIAALDHVGQGAPLPRRQRRPGCGLAASACSPPRPNASFQAYTVDRFSPSAAATSSGCPRPSSGTPPGSASTPAPRGEPPTHHHRPHRRPTHPPETVSR